MVTLPEEPKEALKVLKQTMESELPELKWYTDRPFKVFRARGYEGKKRPFKKAKLILLVSSTRGGAIISVYGPDIFPSAEKIASRIREGYVFGSGVEVGIAREY